MTLACMALREQGGGCKSKACECALPPSQTRPVPNMRSIPTTMGTEVTTYPKGTDWFKREGFFESTACVAKLFHDMGTEP